MMLLSALRKVEKRTTLRAEWTCGDTTERYFDYVLKKTIRGKPPIPATERWGLVSYADFFWAAFTFAHLARWAAAIFLRAAADIVFLLGMLTTFCFCPALLRTFAHRALWAAAILSLAAADKRLRVPALFPYEPPLSAASAASRRSTTLAA
jgi:hypothetical protein